MLTVTQHVRDRVGCALGIVVLAVTVSAPAARSATPCPRPHWVGSWMTSPSDASARALTDQTLRMIVSPHLGGQRLRVRVSNRFGTTSVTLGPVRIGRRGQGAALAPGSPRTVRFGGHSTVTIPAGREAVSDPVNMRITAFAPLAVSVSVTGTVAAPTEHAITRQTSYLSPAGSGDHTGDIGAAAFTEPTATGRSSGWYFLDGIDVQAPAITGALVTFGDSITDGYRSAGAGEDLGTGEDNARYPDFLAHRLARANVPLSVLNAGISGNRINEDGYLPAFGPSGRSRLRADALDRAGVTGVLVLEGINDVGLTPSPASDVIAGLRHLLRQVHTAHRRAIVGTLVPSAGYGLTTYGSEQADEIRRTINTWIRTRSGADAVVDFDRALRDPEHPSRLAAAFDSGDHLHPSAAGYRAMAGAVPMSALGGTAAPSTRCG